MRASFALGLCCAAAIGCSRGGDENLGLSARPEEAAIDTARLVEPAQLVRALVMPGRTVDKKLGARRIDASGTMKVEPPGRPAESLDEVWRLSSDGGGALHLLHDNSRSQGFEAIVTGGDIYVRPRWGKMVKRKPEGDEVERLRASIEGVAGEYLGLLQRFIKVKDNGHAQVAGRNGVRLKLVASAQPGALTPEQDPAKKWRDTVQPKYIDGEVVVDAGSGAPLVADVQASYTFQREGEKAPVVVTLTYKMNTSAAEPIAAPLEFVPVPKRTRPLVEQKELLEGLQ
jgi:hypothetical protein